MLWAKTRHRFVYSLLRSVFVSHNITEYVQENILQSFNLQIQKRKHNAAWNECMAEVHTMQPVLYIHSLK